MVAIDFQIRQERFEQIHPLLLANGRLHFLFGCGHLVCSQIELCLAPEQFLGRGFQLVETRKGSAIFALDDARTDEIIMIRKVIEILGKFRRDLIHGTGGFQLWFQLLVFRQQFVAQHLGFLNLNLFQLQGIDRGLDRGQRRLGLVKLICGHQLGEFGLLESQLALQLLGQLGFAFQTHDLGNIGFQRLVLGFHLGTATPGFRDAASCRAQQIAQRHQIAFGLYQGFFAGNGIFQRIGDCGPFLGMGRVFWFGGPFGITQ